RREDRGDETRLARPGLAHEADQLGSAALHAVERALELVQLVYTADERRREPERGEPAAGPWLGHRAEQPIDHERLRLAAQGELAARLESEGMAGSGGGRL